MPAIYAHKMFGERILSCLSRERFPEIFAHPEAFALGLHGPDVLFYYRPLQKNPVSDKGNAMHEASAAPFFTRARDIIKNTPQEQACRAYLYGFVCHFCLDSVCHPTVAELMARYSLTHTAVEAALERSMLLADGVSPTRTKLATHIQATPETIAAVSLVCGVTPAQAKKAIRSMRFYSGLLRAANPVKRGIVRSALRLAHKKSILDMMLLPTAPPSYADIGEALSLKFTAALPKAKALLLNLRAFLDGTEALDGRFSTNYESEEQL